MAKRPSTPVEKKPTNTASASRELPLVALRQPVTFPQLIVPLQGARATVVTAPTTWVCLIHPGAVPLRRASLRGHHQQDRNRPGITDDC